MLAIMKQGWKDLAYIHWRYDPAVVQALLPEGLLADTYDGSAWVGLIPFSMRGIGLPKLPGIPYLGSFPEVNVRTYVTCNGVPGVWFFSLDVNRLLPAVVARTTYRLPYCWGRASNTLKNDVLTTEVRRWWPRGTATLALKIRIGGKIEQPNELQDFLSARWRLFSLAGRKKLRSAPVSHEPWMLFAAEIEHIEDSLVVAAGLPQPEGTPHVMFSPGVSVRVGLPSRT